jgi:iron(III) transport system substrate-binding protein
MLPAATRPAQVTAVTRRQILKAGAALAATPLLGRIAPAAAQTPVKATKVLDFMTGADVAKAEAEGEVVYYSHDGEAGIAALLDAFRKDFPKIKTSYVRAQTGALYA